MTPTENKGTPQSLDDLVESIHRIPGNLEYWTLHAKGEVHDYLANRFGPAMIEAEKFGPEVVDLIINLYKHCTAQGKNNGDK